MRLSCDAVFLGEEAQLKTLLSVKMRLVSKPSPHGETAYVPDATPGGHAGRPTPNVSGMPAVLLGAAAVAATAPAVRPLPSPTLADPAVAAGAAADDLVRRRVVRRTLRDRPGLLRGIVPTPTPPRQDGRRLSTGAGPSAHAGLADRGRGPAAALADGLCQPPVGGGLCALWL